MTTAMHQENKNIKSANRLFPVFLKLEELNTLIIGGGSVGLEKLSAILNNSPAASVTLVAPVIKEEIIYLAGKYENVKILSRHFIPADFENKDIVIAATNDKELNRAIKQEARSKRILTNVADTPDLCDFYLSSIVQKGSMKLAISTNGKSPTIAKRIKEFLSEAIPDELESSLDDLVVIRSRLKGNFAEKVKRLNKITSVLAVEPKRISPGFFLLVVISACALMIAGHLILQNISFSFVNDVVNNISSVSIL